MHMSQTAPEHKIRGLQTLGNILNIGQRGSTHSETSKNEAGRSPIKILDFQVENLKTVQL